jgi:DNA-directed RNA polymerase specialized sigma24 family protein
LLAATGREGGLAMQEADAVLAALASLGRRDRVAARIVLQRVIPGLVTTAVRRTAGRPGERQALFDDLVASAWLVIRAFPIERRPAKIAVNVLRDAEYLTCVRPTRLRSAGEVPTLVNPDDRHLTWCEIDGRHAGSTTAVSELADVLAIAVAAGVSQRDAAMLAATTIEGRPADEVAKRFAVTTRTVRNRRVRTTATLAALMAA